MTAAGSFQQPGGIQETAWVFVTLLSVKIGAEAWLVASRTLLVTCEVLSD